MTSANQFIVGFVSFFDGFRTVARSRRLKILVLCPILIFIVLFSIGVFGFSSWILDISHWLQEVVQQQFSIQTDLSFLFVFLAWVTYFVVFFLLIYLFGRALASPFYALIAEQILKETHVKNPPAHHLSLWVGLNLRMLFISLLEAVLFTFLGFLFFILAFVPPFGILSPMLFLFLMTFDASAFTFENLELGFRERFSFLKRNLFYFLGFSCALGLTLLIPVLNLTLFPFYVAGAAKLTAHILKKEGLHADQSSSVQTS